VTSGKTYLPGFAERYTEARGVRLRWFEAGSGPDLALLHGFGGAASNWAAVAPALAQDHRVLVADLPGHGGSSALPAAPARLDPYADRVASLLGGPTVLVGHSLGAVVALRLAIRHPKLVRGVVLAAAAGIGSSSASSARALALTSVLQPGRRVAPLGSVIARSPTLRTFAFGVVSVADPRALDPFVAEAFLAGSGLYRDLGAAGAALVRSDSRLDLERLRCPVFVLHGARDVQVPLRDAFEYTRRLRAPLRVIADCGHLLIAERPRAVVAAVRWFLDGIRDVEELPIERELAR
jgi:pimeloyl-ACP methyl ester carboxylesterase